MKGLKISAKSSLVIGSSCEIENVEVDGFLEINREGKVTESRKDKNYKEIKALVGSEQAYLQIRGYTLS